MSMKSIGHDLFYSVTHANGKSTVEHARVWDGQRFMDAQRMHGAKPEKKEERYTVAIATKAEYEGARA